jgi:hypothetical protein
MAAGRSSTPESQRRAAVLLRAAAVFAVLFGIAFALWKHFSEAAVIMGTILLIEAVCLWKMGGGSNPFNTLTPEIQSVPGMRIPIGELKSVFDDVETQLGYPWIGKIQTMKQDSIIYGPSEDGFCVYGYYLFGQFYISGSTNPLFPDPEDAQGHITEEIPDSDGILLAKENLPEAYRNMFTRYTEKGEARWSTDLSDH